MIYVLFAIAAFMAIISAFIVNSMPKTSKYSKLNKVIVIVISILAYVLVAVYLLQQDSIK